MDQVRYRFLAQIAAAIDVVISGIFLVIGWAFAIYGTVTAKKIQKDLEESGFKDDGTLTASLIIHWIIICIVTLFTCILIWAAVNLILATRLGDKGSPEQAQRASRIWMIIGICFLVANLLDLFLGRHWAVVLVWVVYRVAMITIAGVFLGQLKNFRRMYN